VEFPGLDWISDGVAMWGGMCVWHLQARIRTSPRSFGGMCDQTGMCIAHVQTCGRICLCGKDRLFVCFCDVFLVDCRAHGVCCFNPSRCTIDANQVLWSVCNSWVSCCCWSKCWGDWARTQLCVIAGVGSCLCSCLGWEQTLCPSPTSFCYPCSCSCSVGLLLLLSCAHAIWIAAPRIQGNNHSSSR
jgi:hypothetical protein